MRAKADMSWKRTIFGKARNGFSSGFITTLYALRIIVYLQMRFGLFTRRRSNRFNLRVADSRVSLRNDNADLNVGLTS